MRWARLLTALWVIVTLVALGWPGDALPETPAPGLDKVAHLLLFGAGTVGALMGWPHRAVRVLAALLLFAPLTELWQHVLPTGRQAEALDVVANALGVGLGWLAWRFLVRGDGGARPTRPRSSS